MNVVIFSKNRAAQLDLLYQSLRKNAPWIDDPTTVIAHSSAEFLHGYLDVLPRVGRRLYDSMGGFEVAALAAIDHRDDHLMFLTDDQVVYAPMPEPRVVHNSSFSMRLGKNCTWCYPPHCTQEEGTLDFDYPSIDARVMRTSEFLSVATVFDWSTPNELENGLLSAWRSGIWHPKILYSDHSCVVSIPHNTVVSNPGVRNSGGTAEELNDRFLAGERLDLESMDFSDVKACHQEISYVWRKR